jgi:hypothetical protein
VSATAPDLAERYGAPSRRNRPVLLALVAVLVLAGGAWLVWAVAGGGRSAVSSQMVGFEVRGEHAVTATFTVVRRDPQARVTCVVRALADDHAVVGEASVPVRSGAASRQVSTTVRTERRATGVDLVDCRVPTG